MNEGYAAQRLPIALADPQLSVWRPGKMGREFESSPVRQ